MLSPATILIENVNTVDTLNGRDTDLDLASYHLKTAGGFGNRHHTRSENARVTVASVVDQLLIDNIEEKEDENVDQELKKEKDAYSRDSPITGHANQMTTQFSHTTNTGK